MVERWSFPFGIWPFSGALAVSFIWKSAGPPQQEKTDPLVASFGKNNQPLNFDPGSVMPLMVTVHLFQFFFKYNPAPLWKGNHLIISDDHEGIQGSRGVDVFCTLGFRSVFIGLFVKEPPGFWKEAINDQPKNRPRKLSDLAESTIAIALRHDMRSVKVMLWLHSWQMMAMQKEWRRKQRCAAPKVSFFVVVVVVLVVLVVVVSVFCF